MLEGACLCGSSRWRLAALPASATACNCSACRRYGALWAYGELGADVRLEGDSQAYVRQDLGSDPALSFNFCARCGGLTHWFGLTVDAAGHRRVAVNLRMVLDPHAVAEVPVRHFDGGDTWTALPDDGRQLRHHWF